MSINYTNSKIFFDFEVHDKHDCGLELQGFEVKSIRAGLINLTGSKVILRGGEAYVVGLSIQPFQPNNTPKNREELRTIKLLFKKNEIAKLYKTIESKKIHLIPLRIFDAHGLIKMEVAECAKLNKINKKQKIKERDLDRSLFL